MYVTNGTQINNYTELQSCSFKLQKNACCKKQMLSKIYETVSRNKNEENVNSNSSIVGK